MMKLRIAKKSDIKELKILFSICFNEKDIAIDYFFLKRVDLNNTVVLTINNKIICALYLINTNIFLNNKLFPAHYLYAAGTHPDYRNNGYMQNLIDFANCYSLKLGKMYSVLLPANNSLYNYYKKFGYEELFKIRNVFISKNEMKKYQNTSNTNDFSYSFNDISKLRLNKLKQFDANIIWNKNDIQYAVTLNKIYGGKLISIDNGYAICNNENNCVKVYEFITENKNAYNLIAKIGSCYPNCDCYLRVPIFDFNFKNHGEIVRFGLIKPLNSISKKELLNIKNKGLYLGLTLD